MNKRKNAYVKGNATFLILYQIYTGIQVLGLKSIGWFKHVCPVRKGDQRVIYTVPKFCDYYHYFGDLCLDYVVQAKFSKSPTIIISTELNIPSRIVF